MLDREQVARLTYTKFIGKGLYALDMGEPWTGESWVIDSPPSVQARLAREVLVQGRENIRGARHAQR